MLLTDVSLNGVAREISRRVAVTGEPCAMRCFLEHGSSHGLVSMWVIFEMSIWNMGGIEVVEEGQ